MNKGVWGIVLVVAALTVGSARAEGWEYWEQDIRLGPQDSSFRVHTGCFHMPRSATADGGTLRLSSPHSPAAVTTPLDTADVRGEGILWSSLPGPPDMGLAYAVHRPNQGFDNKYDQQQERLSPTIARLVPSLGGGECNGEWVARTAVDQGARLHWSVVLEPAAPDSVVAWSGFAAVQIDGGSGDLSCWPQDSQRALDHALRLGGRLLIVGCGPEIHHHPFIAPLDPVTFVRSDDPTGADLAAFAPLLKDGRRQALDGDLYEHFPLTVASLAPGARLILGTPERPLVAARDVGRGTVVFIATKQALRTFLEAGTRFVYTKGSVAMNLAVPVRRPAPAGDSRLAMLLTYSRAAFGMRLPRLWEVLVLLAAYVLVLVPLQLRYLRRGRGQLMWVLTPVLSLACCVGVYAYALVLRGPFTAVHSTSLIEVGSGETAALATTVTALHALTDGAFRVELPPDTAGVSPADAGDRSSDAVMSARTTPIVMTCRGLQRGIEAMHVAALATRRIVYGYPTRLDGPVTCNLIYTPDFVRGTVRNETGRTLTGAVLVVAGVCGRLGDLRPGETTTLDRAARTQARPGEVASLLRDGADRLQPMARLAPRRSADGALPETPPDQAALFAWVVGADSPARVADAPARPGLTLLCVTARPRLAAEAADFRAAPMRWSEPKPPAPPPAPGQPIMVYPPPVYWVQLPCRAGEGRCTALRLSSVPVAPPPAFNPGLQLWDAGACEWQEIEPPPPGSGDGSTALNAPQRFVDADGRIFLRTDADEPPVVTARLEP